MTCRPSRSSAQLSGPLRNARSSSVSNSEPPAAAADSRVLVAAATRVTSSLALASVRPGAVSSRHQPYPTSARARTSNVTQPLSRHPPRCLSTQSG